MFIPILQNRMRFVDIKSIILLRYCTKDNYVEFRAHVYARHIEQKRGNQTRSWLRHFETYYL